MLTLTIKKIKSTSSTAKLTNTFSGFKEKENKPVVKINLELILYFNFVQTVLLNTC